MSLLMGYSSRVSPSLPATNAKRLRKGAKRRSNPSIPCRSMDCFAALAMTAPSIRLHIFLRDDLEQRLCLVVDVGLAVLHGGQDHVVILTIGAHQRGEQLGHHRLVGQCL